MKTKDHADLRIGEMTAKEVAAKLGTSRQNVTRIELAAMRKLKRSPLAMALVRQLLEGR